jgi:hypothetical protein
LEKTWIEKCRQCQKKEEEAYKIKMSFGRLAVFIPGRPPIVVNWHGIAQLGTEPSLSVLREYMYGPIVSAEVDIFNRVATIYMHQDWRHASILPPNEMVVSLHGIPFHGPMLVNIPNIV